MNLVGTISIYETSCLIDSGAAHNFIHANLLETASLWLSVDELLEVVLANTKRLTLIKYAKFPSTLVKEYTKVLNT